MSAFSLPSRARTATLCFNSTQLTAFNREVNSLGGAGLQSGSMVVNGGYDGQRTFSDTYVLDISDWTWQQVATTGEDIITSPCLPKTSVISNHLR